jgi:GntR family transcriptional regulator/MocR family aminotransferase
MLIAPMSDWSARIFLDPASRAPVFLQIAHAIMAEIHRGRLQPGAMLPGYRALAETLGVNRNTVLNAYRELQAEGWLEVKSGEGSCVVDAPPRHLPAGVSPASEAPSGMGFDLPIQGPGGQSPLPAPGEFPVASGMPDPRLLPTEALARALRRALQAPRKTSLTLEDPQGHPRLREALAQLLRLQRGVPAQADRILVTRGSQMAFFLLAQGLLQPGDGVAVEAMGNRLTWEALQRTGALLFPIPVDEEGVDVAAIAALAEQRALRAVLVTPRRQYPSLVALSEGRRKTLLELASRYRFAILEHDPDAEFHFEGVPAPALAAEDPKGVVIHVGTLSKLFSPGFRLGFVHGPAPLIARLRELRPALDRQGDLPLEQAMAELMEDGEMQRHLNRMLKIYALRRDALCGSLREHLQLDVPPPAGGLALWVNAPGVNVNAWAERAATKGVVFRPGQHFRMDGAEVSAFRMGFSGHTEAELDEVARRMASCR